MLRFFSGSSNNINSRKAIGECLEKALQKEYDLSCDLIIIFTTMGHNFRELLDEAQILSPGTRIIGCTGEGVISREGPNESLKALSVMVVKGPESEFAVAGVDNVSASDPFAAGVRLAEELNRKNPRINLILFYPSLMGFMFNWGKALEGIESVFGTDIPIAGGISVDNQKYITDFQFLDDKIYEKGAVVAGFADESIESVTCSNHGLEVLGVPFEVTRSEGNRILEFDGKPAWTCLMEKLDLSSDTPFKEVATFTTIVRELPEEDRAEYNSNFIVTSAAIPGRDGSLPATITMQEGSRLWLTRRNEKQIFEGVDFMVNHVVSKLKNRETVAVFHADCITRGRLSFNRIAKDSIIRKLQLPILKEEDIPWIGIYAAGQIAPLGGRNHVHIYTSSLCVLVRRITN